MTQIVSAALGLNALREAGYRNTASAVAELVDNSIEAGAEQISIVAMSQEIYVNQRTSSQIYQLAVVDNGQGMPPEVLQNCLSLGWGTRLDRYEGLGRFGFGLKGASISQAKRVEVYSWQNGGEVYKAHLDLEDVEANDLNELPEVQVASLPSALKTYLRSIDGISSSGTAVLWSKLDKLDLKRPDTLMRRMNGDLCRIYRHYLDDDDTYGKRVYVKLHSVDERGAPVSQPITLKSNDPIYLLTPNNLPEHENEATNELQAAYDFPFESPEGSVNVHLRYSIALPEIQDLGGNSTVGKHYAKNTGISILRAGREIQIGSFGFIERSEPRHRWWGMEIRFPPSLDSVFGITNNKQEVRALRHYDEADIEALADSRSEADELGQAEIQFKLDLNKRIKDHVAECMSIIKGRREGRLRGANNIVELVNDEVSVDDSDTLSGHTATAQDVETKIGERAQLLLQNDNTMTEDEAGSLARETIDYRIDIQTGDWPGDIFMDNKVVANAAVAVINRNHPFYDRFWHFLEKANDTRGFESLEVLLMAYCRAEDELASRYDREQFEMLRSRWGALVRQLIHHAGS
jgi:hypothetical protein